MTDTQVNPMKSQPPSLGAGSAVLAFDVGGTDLKAALVDDVGSIRAVVRVPTPIDGDRTADGVLTRISELAGDLLSRNWDVHPRAAGLLVPGHVDDENGVGVFSQNLGWRNYPFRERAEATLGLPVSFGHDVRGAGVAEYRLGAAAPFRDVVIMAVGTGIASAIFIQGRLYTGHGLAGEIGHSKVADGPPCGCGGRGCLEAVASAGAIARRYTQLTGQVVHGAKEVLDRASRGDAGAGQIWESALDALALTLSHTVALLAPEAIVIGGGLSQAGAALFEPLERRLEALLTFQRRPRLLPASLGENAGVIGAALGARDRVDDLTASLARHVAAHPGGRAHPRA